MVVHHLWLGCGVVFGSATPAPSLGEEVGVFSAITRGSFRLGLARNFMSASVECNYVGDSHSLRQNTTIEEEQMAEAGRAGPQRTVRQRATLTGLLNSSNNLDLSLLTLNSSQFISFGILVLLLSGHTQAVTAVRFSPDAKYFASACTRRPQFLYD
jgi:hypothetical protein